MPSKSEQSETPIQAYANVEQDIFNLLRRLDTATQKQKKQPINWAVVNTMQKVRADLREIVEFLNG